jgi:hypothetical protein
MKYLLSVNKTINLLLVVAIVSISLKIVVLDDIPELFRWGAEFGDVYSRVCMAYVSSYIFYFVVVHVKREKDKENINSFINPKIHNACAQWKPQLKDLCNAARVAVPDGVPDKAFLTNLFQQINPNSFAPLLKDVHGNRANWLEYFAYYRARVDRFISMITDKMPFLDSKLVQLLSELSECEHFKFLEVTMAIPLSNTDMSAWASGFHKYCVASNALEEYANECHKQKL